MKAKLFASAIVHGPPGSVGLIENALKWQIVLPIILWQLS